MSKKGQCVFQNGFSDFLFQHFQDKPLNVIWLLWDGAQRSCDGIPSDSMSRANCFCLWNVATPSKTTCLQEHRILWLFLYPAGLSLAVTIITIIFHMWLACSDHPCYHHNADHHPDHEHHRVLSSPSACLSSQAAPPTTFLSTSRLTAIIRFRWVHHGCMAM